MTELYIRVRNQLHRLTHQQDNRYLDQHNDIWTLHERIEKGRGGMRIPVRYVKRMRDARSAEPVYTRPFRIPPPQWEHTLTIPEILHPSTRSDPPKR